MYKTYEAKAAAEKARYEKRKELRVCVDCGKQDSRTLRGLTRCDMCYEKAKKCTREGRRSLYALRKRIGICVSCGREDAFTMNGRSMCAECCEKDAERQRRRHGWKPREKISEKLKSKIPSWERPAYGLCFFCGAPVTARVKANGENVRVCETCWQRCVKNAANAKKAWYEKRKNNVLLQTGI